MKVFMTPTAIISLENVRRVEKCITETKHTSYGKPYAVTHYEIVVSYMGNESERIEFGNGELARVLCDLAFEIIYEKLNEK